MELKQSQRVPQHLHASKQQVHLLSCRLTSTKVVFGQPIDPADSSCAMFHFLFSLVLGRWGGNFNVELFFMFKNFVLQ